MAEDENRTCVKEVVWLGYECVVVVVSRMRVVVGCMCSEVGVAVRI